MEWTSSYLRSFVTSGLSTIQGLLKEYVKDDTTVSFNEFERLYNDVIDNRITDVTKNIVTYYTKPFENEPPYLLFRDIELIYVNIYSNVITDSDSVSKPIDILQSIKIDLPYYTYYMDLLPQRSSTNETFIEYMSFLTRMLKFRILPTINREITISFIKQLNKIFTSNERVYMITKSVKNSVSELPVLAIFVESLNVHDRYKRFFELKYKNENNVDILMFKI